MLLDAVPVHVHLDVVGWAESQIVERVDDADWRHFAFHCFLENADAFRVEQNGKSRLVVTIELRLGVLADLHDELRPGVAGFRWFVSGLSAEQHHLHRPVKQRNGTQHGRSS